MLTQNGNQGRVYGGDPELVHIPDGQRIEMGARLAARLNDLMRSTAKANGDKQAYYSGKPLCPGCYMVALFNAAVTLAKVSGQPLAELGRSMAGAFNALADCPEGDTACIESITVKLDGGLS
jgi:hypothetical protein